MKSFIEKANIESLRFIIHYHESNDINVILRDERIINYDISEDEMIILKIGKISYNDLVILNYISFKINDYDEILKMLDEYNFNVIRGEIDSRTLNLKLKKYMGISGNLYLKKKR